MNGVSSMEVSVFVGTSVDGFLAREDGALDFLPAESEEHGYEAFIASVDVIVIGRNTYDTVLRFPEWPYGSKPVVVLSGRPIPAPPAADAVVELMSGEPRDVVARLAERGAGHLYVDGGITVQGFLRAGLVTRLVITRVPVLIGGGIPLFGPLPRDVRLEHVATRQYPSGLVQSEYRVAVGPGAP